MTKYILFFDIDGTLLDVKSQIMEPTIDTKDAIKELQAQGHLCFLATGRAKPYLNPKILNINFDGMVTNNGGSVILNDEEIISHPFEKQELREIVSYFEEKNAPYTLCDEKKAYAPYHLKEVYDVFNKFEVPKENTCGEFEIDELVISKIETQTVTDEVAQYIRNLGKKGYEIVEYKGTNIFEINKPKVTKGKTILEVLDSLNIPIENSIAFGDGYNDIEMLEVVGYGVAMGNASDEVKKHAKKVTESCFDHGIVNELKRLGLIGG